MKKLESGTIIAGKYRLERPLDSGGMGSLWIAVHLELEIELAMKFPQVEVLASGDPEWRTRFKREARAAARLRNRHVVEIKDYGIDDDMPYIVMELLCGEDLGQRLHNVGRLSVEEARSLLAQLVIALADAHRQNIIHRDLKPANIFLASDSWGETAKIVDFGIARFQGETMITAKGVVMGSLAYMSPEQLAGEISLDTRCDIWSLGAVLFEALAGRRMHTLPADPMSAIRVRQLESIPRLTSFVPDLSPALDDFFYQALAIDPMHRFQSVHEMMAAFEKVARSCGADNKIAHFCADELKELMADSEGGVARDAATRPLLLVTDKTIASQEPAERPISVLVEASAVRPQLTPGLANALWMLLTLAVGGSITYVLSR